MRTIGAMIVGCLFTLTGLYVHDVLETGTIPTSASASPPGAIVNWNVALSEMGIVSEEVQIALPNPKGAKVEPNRRSAAVIK